MKKTSLLIVFLFLSLFAAAQTQSFELLNSDAIELTGEKLTFLTTHSWKVDRVDTQIRNETVHTKGWAFLEFEKGNLFEYGGKRGSWELIEKKYLRYQLDSPEEEANYNFGGTYAVVSLTDTTLALTKILTSTRDMKRTIFLYNSDYFKAKMMASMEKYYKGNLNKKTLDSISYLSEELLLKVGFHHGFYLVGDTVFINTEEAVYKIKRNSH